MDNLRIAHISDLHFSSITYHPKQFLSKRWLGNCNLILFRQIYQTKHLTDLPELFASFNIELVAITGDLTTTSLDQEYLQAKKFVESLEKRHLMTTVLPGNHDIYTKGSEKKRRFYHYFPSTTVESQVEVKKIKEGFWWVGLHCAYASNLFLSNGRFTATSEKQLQEALEKIPSKDCIVLGNHFPLFSTGNLRHDLHGAERLQALLKRYPNVKLYLHGHDHSCYVVDKRNEGLPLTCNAGSLSHFEKGTFYLLDLSKERCIWQQFNLKYPGWTLHQEKEFTFS